MAGEDLFASLMAAKYKPSDSGYGEDLFASLMAAQYKPSDSGYGIAARGVASALPSLVDPYGSVGGNFAAVLGGALVAGLLGYQAKESANASNLAQAGFVSQLLRPGITDEERTAIMQEDPKLINFAQSLQFNQLAAQQSAAATAAAERAKAEMQADVEVRKTNAIDAGVNFDGTSIAGTGVGSPGFGTKGEAILNEAQKQLRDSDASKTYTAVKATLERLAGGVANMSAVSDIDFAKGAIQVIEPGLATNQGETNAIEGATSIPSMLKAAMGKAVSGGGSITLKQRAEIMEIAKRAYETRANTYNQTVDQLKNNVIARTRRQDLSDQIDARLAPGGKAPSYPDLVQKWFKVPGYELEDASADSILTNLASGQLTQEGLFGALAARKAAKEAPKQAAVAPSAAVPQAVAVEATPSMVAPTRSYNPYEGSTVVAAPTATPGSNIAAMLSAAPTAAPTAAPAAAPKMQAAPTAAPAMLEAPLPTVSPQIAVNKLAAQQQLKTLMAKGRLNWSPADNALYAELYNKYEGR